MKKMLLAFLALCAAGTTFANNQDLDWLTTASGGLVAMPPVSVTDGAVSKASWAPDGSYLFVVERPNALTQEQALLTGAGYAPGNLHLLAWDKEFQRVRTLWTSEDPTQTVESIDWIHGTSAAYVTFKWTAQDSPNTAAHSVYGVIWLDANSGKFLWVAGMEHLLSRPHIYPSPLKPLVAAVFSDNPAGESGTLRTWVASGSSNESTGSTIRMVIQGETTALLDSYFAVDQPNVKANNYWTLDSSGGIKNSIKLDHMLQLPLLWNQDGSAWFLQQMDQAAGKQGLFRLTPQGELEKTDEVEFNPVPKEPTLAVEHKPGSTELGKSKVGFTSLWLKSLHPSDHSEFNLTPNGESPELSPSEGAVFYIDGGVAKVRSLIALSKDQMKRILTAAKENATAVNLQELTVISGTPIRFSLQELVNQPPPKP